MPIPTTRRLPWLILSVLALTALAAPARNHDPAPQPTPPTETAAEATSDARVPSPLMQEIRIAFETEQTALAELKSRLEQATDEHEILSLLKEIERVKQETELQVLQIQADFARREGRFETADQIEAAIADLRAGPSRGDPGESHRGPVGTPVRR